MRNICIAAVAALLAGVACAVTNNTMPSYYAVGNTPYELGFSIGVQQKEAFQELLKADDSLRTVLEPWMQRHPEDYKAFHKKNRLAYPDVYDEIRGIAAGAELSEDDTMLMMLRPEIESLVADELGIEMPNENCFDIIHNPAADDKKNVAFIAHNEDWTPAYKPFGFVLHENMAYRSTGTKHIVAFTYPACPVGFTFGYNDHGVVTSCNGLNPHPCRVGGRARYFINRHVLSATSIDDALKRLRDAAPESALGFGMSIGSANNRTIYHAEMAPGSVDIIEIKPGQSYLHSNSYTHEAYKNINQTTSPSTSHRLARAAEMPEPTTPELALNILGDETTPVYPIYRYGIPPDELATISTAVLDLDNALVTIYGGNPTQHDPVVLMPIFGNGPHPEPHPQPEPPTPSPEPKPTPEPSSNSKSFIVVSVFAVFFAVTTLVLAIVLAVVKKQKNQGLTVNSGYQPVA